MMVFKSNNGNVAMIFAIMLVPVLALIGGALDMSRHRSAENQAQIALDAALLSVAHEHDTKDLSVVQSEVDKKFRKQQSGNKIVVTNLKVWREDEALNASVEGYIETTLLGILGVHRLNLQEVSQIRFSEKSTEIAMVLDITGSMRGQKFSDLKTATLQLLDRFEQINVAVGNNEKYRVSLIPFADYVNVGPDQRNAQWIDRKGRSAISASNLAPGIDRIALYDHLGFEWSGCVEARAYPLDIDATKPTIAQPETLFTPLFHPDEPDDDTQYQNSYIDDYMPTGDILADTGNIHKYGIAPGDEKISSRWTSVPIQVPDLENIKDPSRDTPNPGFRCPTQPIVPLTGDYNRLRAAVNGLEISGATNLTNGLAWGWRTLSNDEPFRQAAPHNSDMIEKKLILVTDGNNYIKELDNDYGARYSAYGYKANGRLILSTGESEDDIEREMDRRTAKVCENIKKAGITLYVIRVEMDDERSENLMRACASSPEHFLDVSSSEKLDETFKLISRRVTNLYLSK